jgi:hypothetical protein
MPYPGQIAGTTKTRRSGPAGWHLADCGHESAGREADCDAADAGADIQGPKPNGDGESTDGAEVNEQAQRAGTGEHKSDRQNHRRRPSKAPQTRWDEIRKEPRSAIRQACFDIPRFPGGEVYIRLGFTVQAQSLLLSLHTSL